MAETEKSMSTDEVKKPKKRSIVERELETNLTAQVTSPVTGEGMSTSRYGRARRLKTGESEKTSIIDLKSPNSDNTSDKSPTSYKIHALNSPYKAVTCSNESTISTQIDSIYQENKSLSRFNDHSPSPVKKSPKVYVRKDLIQTKDDDDDIILIKNLFSPIKQTNKVTRSVITNLTKQNNNKETTVIDDHEKKNDSTENHNVQIKIEKEMNVKTEIDTTEKSSTNQNDIDNTSVVKTLDFDNCRRKGRSNRAVVSKNELFEIEAKSPYQVGDVAWARMGTFPFWPCIVTRDPYSQMFVKKKLFGRVEHNILHVTFFADNGRRSWIVDNMLKPYAGRAEFESTKEKFTVEDKKKDPRLYAAFFISEKKQALWNISVDEAETLMKEPKRLRIDILNQMIHKIREMKKQTKTGKITRTDSDVSLSESLYDSLFSEDDSKTEEGRLKNRLRKPKSFDVSDVVTACLDNMAAKTGNSKIQRQSHMDRWLQKAKSKTPEKKQNKVINKTESKSARVRKSKSSKKAASKSVSISNTDESNISDLDVKSSAGKDSSAEESMSVCGSKTIEGLKTPILLDDNVENPCLAPITAVAIKQELIDQENDKNGDKYEKREAVIINLCENKINPGSDELINKQNLTSESNENINVAEENKSESHKKGFELKVDSTNESSEFENREIIDTKTGTNNSEAMNINDNSTSETNVKIDSTQENVISSISDDKNISEFNENSDAKVEESKKNETCDNEISSSVVEPSTCEIMEDQFPQETKLIEDSNIKVDTDLNKNKTIILDEPSALAEQSGQINQTPSFLDVDHKHLRDESIDNDSNKKIDLIDLNIEAEVPKNRGKDQSLNSNIYSTNMNMKEITLNDIEEDDTLNKADDVLNDSGNSESILLSNTMDYEENDAINVVAVEKNNKEPMVYEENVRKEIGYKAKNDLEEKGNKMDHNEHTILEQTLIKVSSTPKHSTEDISSIEEKLYQMHHVSDSEECYEIEDSDEEPSPEYEPLGEDITEDFRKHMQTIEQCVTDKKDEEQIVKICDQITKTIKQESLECISPTKVQVEKVEFQQKSPIIQVKAMSSLDKSAENNSSRIEFLKDNSPKNIEQQNFEVHNVSKTSIPDKSIEDLINHLSPKGSSETKSVQYSENLKLNVTTRSKSKKLHSEFEQIDTRTVGNADIEQIGDLKKYIVLDKSVDSKHDLVLNGSIGEIYCKMRANEPKVVLTPLKNVIKDIPKTDGNKRSGKKLKLSLKKNRLREKDSSDLDISVDEPSIKTESNRKSTVVSIENRIEATIPTTKQNGHSSNNSPILPDDDDFNVDAASIGSNDSNVSTVKCSSPTPRRSTRCKKSFSNREGREFLHYLQLRQDYLLDEYPGLSEDEIETYLQKTWEYEESLKCDVKKMYNNRNFNLVKGSEQVTPPYKESRNRKSKKKNLKNCIDNYCPDKRDKKIANDKLEPTIIKSGELAIDAKVNLIADTQPSFSKATRSLDKNMNGIVSEIKTTPKFNKEKIEIETIIPVKPTVTIELNEDTHVDLVHDNEIKEEIDTTSVLNDVSTPKSSKKQRLSNLITSKSIQSTTETPKVSVKNEDMETESIHSDSEIPLRQLRSKVLKDKLNVTKELSPAVVKEESEVISVQSDDEPLNKHKNKNYKKTDNSYENPEFCKFMELRQDALIDENPQLTKEEVVDYLYKTWLYEESLKSDIKKNDEIEQSTLVKGLNQDISPKKAKRKQKLDKTTNRVDEEPNREKPKRKIVQPFYNEEFYSDIEEEIELFEIFRQKSTVTKKEIRHTQNVNIEKSNRIIEINEDTDKITMNNEVTKALVKEDDVQLIDKEAIRDSWETYFAGLLQPKPNVFKGLVREKVCEICEKTSNLYKCKGCNGMFHPGCLEMIEIDINTPNKGRKKKPKKPGRKNKNHEDCESQSDEKSQDMFDERDVSLEEIITDDCTVDAEALESKISEKMKEMLNAADNAHYDSYSSDDGVDWTDTVAGKCEIVDVKLKPKTPTVDYTNFRCNNCQRFDTPVCFVCKLAVSKGDVKMRQKCHVAQCHKYYHLECLDQWPQTQFQSGEPSRHNKKINEFFEALSCPRHVCHTCVSDDPRGCRTRFSGDKLARCIRCPATYHSFTKCLPAGSQILTSSQIICPRHYQHVSRPGVNCHVNTGWCFICALGGSLICCEYCPTSFHAECLNIKPPEGNYMCEDCETGRLPLYGEMVWVKLGHYRWWPGIILHPSEISDNLMSVKHGLGEFVVRFFGQYDHYWVNRGRVFPYQEGDSGRISNQRTKIDAAFTTAMEHAQRAFEILKNAKPNEEESTEISSSFLPPHYVKLKCNKPCGSLISRREDPALSLTQCECDPSEEDPCGPYSHCLNRMLLTECGPTCRAGERCNNRAFEKRLYPKMVPYRTPHRGWGLKTLEEVKAGQFVIEYVGELIDEEEFRRRMRRKHEIRDENYYFLTLDKERMIDAGPKGNLARFMNHCCEPNCETQKWTVLGDVRVGLFALSDIPANSEVTFNYNLECAGIDKKRCMCGAKRCAGYIGAKPKQDENQSKKGKAKLSHHSNKEGASIAKRIYNKKRKTIDTKKNKPKKPLGRPPKPRELTEIEKDLLIIKNATIDMSSDDNASTSSKTPKDTINDKFVTSIKKASSKNDTNANIASRKNTNSHPIIKSENTTNKSHATRDTKKVLTNGIDANFSDKSRTKSLDGKPKALKRKLVSNSMEDSKFSNSAPKRQKRDGVGD